MILSEKLQHVLRSRGLYLTEACDRCGSLLGQVRWTVHGKPAAWCSKKCRDGVEHQFGVCRGCGTSLGGKRTGAFYCGRTCRMRAVRRGVQNSANNVNTHIQKIGLADEVSRLGYGESPESPDRAHRPTNASEAQS